MNWELVVKESFSSAHFLEHYHGKCENMHGHTFQIELHLKVSKLDEAGISIDFTDIKKYLKEILPDHKVLNEVFDFTPSAENLARYFYFKVKKKYPVSKVCIWESENAGAIFPGD